MMRKTILGGIWLACACGRSAAAGYYLPNQDAFATAKGNAFVATADNPSAVFYNPAGLTQLDQPEFQAGFYSIILGNRAKIDGSTYGTDSEIQVAPQLFYGAAINDRLSYGFGLNSPFGLGTDWGQNTPFRSVVTEARLLYASGTAALAYELTDELSVGVSLSANYADLKLAQGIYGVPGSYFKFTGDGFAPAASIGLRWQPLEKHAFGFNFTTQSDFTLRGRTDSNLLPDDSSSNMNFITPARLAAGYSYRPAPGWNLEANVEWIDWDSLNTLKLKTSSAGGDSVAVPFEWESSFIYELGVSYTTPSGYVIAAGYDYNESAQPDQNFNPGVSDADRHWFNAGFGHRGDCSDWMLAYQFGYSNRDVTGSSVPEANGRYEARHHALVFSWNYRF
ncbi:outer membrane protein transport protein [Luteolibacter pohnpeiensis]|uniref:Outer membrane protein transport protein n=1 Tax=Luteolibacter pohnpeiensis TaxID=454153 RepID=A0A934VV09_9BACT|nr:outer membrane protein transport protein [Luteolibacter pohnpeiensis]MBK1881059.1 outer membrane protein transport protein [Luteolibacter pohnpeiensis]